MKKSLNTLLKNHEGMSLVEMIFAITVFTAFFGVFVATTQLSTKFFNSIENSNITSDGLLIDHHYLYTVMDKISYTLSQPGFSKEELLSMTKKCARDPIQEWNLPGEKLNVVNGFRICLRTTSIQEPDNIYNQDNTLKSSSVEQLLNGANPGIYILQALPDELSPASIPARRMFCRPQPFCG